MVTAADRAGSRSVSADVRRVNARRSSSVEVEQQVALFARQPAVEPVPVWRPATVLSLQRTHGNRATQRMLATKTMPGMVIQRKEMNAADIVKALTGISFIKKKLDQKLILGAGTPRQTDLYKMQTHVEAVLQQYEGHLKGTEGDKSVRQAMMIATVLEAVARVIALNELNDPALTPVLALKLLELYRPEIERKLKKMDDRDQTLLITLGLVAGDPVSLYMHKELRLEEAARKVRSMARGADLAPARMFRLLRQRFEIEMASLTRTGVDQRSQGSDVAYSLAEATGEISTRYFEQLFGAGVEQPAWTTDASNRNVLTFTQDAARLLDDLEAAVTALPGNLAGEQTESNLTWKQDQHLHDLKEKEAQLDYGDIDTRAEGAIAQLLHVSPGEAKSILQKVKSRLQSLPITLTVQGMEWFGSGRPVQGVAGRGGTDWVTGSTRTKQKTHAELFGKKKAAGGISYLGKWEKPRGGLQDRGAQYTRFRAWKDQLQTGSWGFADEELPAFAAVNVNWPAYASVHESQQNFAISAYGDTHFVLDKSTFADRCVYTATDHGQPRRDIYLAFCDFLFGAPGITGLKDPRFFQSTGARIAAHVINAVVSEQPVAAGTQPFEVQIFGGLDLATDVRKIYVAPSIRNQIQANVQAFAADYGIDVEFIANPGPVIESERWLAPPPGQPNVASGLEQEVKRVIQQQMRQERKALRKEQKALMAIRL